MVDVIIDTLLDGIKLLPFLFLTFLLIEFIEHKVDNKKIISKSKNFGPLIGSVLGAFPQCGFSVSATNLYITRIISLGTLISVYLSTSDEMLPIMISNNVEFFLILKIVLIKVFIGILCGFLIDFILRNQNKNKKTEVSTFCDEHHCHCEKNIFISSLKHTLNIFLFIIIVSFILNTCLSYFGVDRMSKIFLKNSIFGSFITPIIGIIPNCASSVVITELYLSSMISFGSLISGLLMGSGLGVLILFKYNKNYKENISIILIMYLISSFFGIIIDLIGKVL